MPGLYRESRHFNVAQPSGIISRETRNTAIAGVEGISLVRQKPEIGAEGHELFSTPAHALVAEMATGLGA